MEGNAAGARQIQLRSRTTELQRPLGLRGQAVTVVNGGTCGKLGGIEVRARSLRDNA